MLYRTILSSSLPTKDPFILPFSLKITFYVLSRPFNGL